MQVIKLERGTWQFDENDPLGPEGGFCEVFRGVGESGEVAVKRLKITASAAAHREMKIGKNLAARDLQNVVEVLDYGQDADSDRYFLIMPVCDYSLQEYLDKNGPLSWELAKPIALDIASGLSEVGEFVHRDLKPGNVLWRGGKWQVSDFGIAKFVEDSTSLETLRSSLTPTYAAPEQWLGEAPTRATDVYALACILHAIINGAPPFNGDVDTIRKAHLETSPPTLDQVPPRLNSIATHMLRKTAASRPTLQRFTKVFEGLDSSSGKPHKIALAEAGQAVAHKEAEEETRRRAAEKTRKDRAEMGKEAILDLKRSVQEMINEIETSSESVQRNQRAIILGPAHLTLSESEMMSERLLSENEKFNLGWDIVAYSGISIRAEIERIVASDRPTYTLSSSLFFGRIENEGEYRWYEVSFWKWNAGRDHAPFALNPTEREFWVANSNVVGNYHVAFGPKAIDAEDEEQFQERWLSLFARAANNKLRYPNQMPPPASFFENQ